MHSARECGRVGGKSGRSPGLAVIDVFKFLARTQACFAARPAASAPGLVRRWESGVLRMRYGVAVKQLQAGTVRSRVTGCGKHRACGLNVRAHGSRGACGDVGGHRATWPQELAYTYIAHVQEWWLMGVARVGDWRAGVYRVLHGCTVVWLQAGDSPGYRSGEVDGGTGLMP